MDNLTFMYGKEKYYQLESKPRFEKVSRVKDLDFNLPKRKTKYSAGYDFELIEDVTIQPNQKVLIPTGVKAYMPSDMYLEIVIRSSLGIKQDLRFVLGKAVIDADYYNNPDNEGEMLLPIINDGELPVTLTKGTRVAQGIFLRYFTTENDDTNAIRMGGVGSTDEVK